MPGGSVLQDNIFKNLFGEKSSAISVYNSRLVLRSQGPLDDDESDDDDDRDVRELFFKKKKIVHFEHNISSIGTTIYGF